MVDELGGTETAIAYAAKKAGLEPGTYDIRTLPAPRTIADFLGLGSREEADAQLPLGRPIISIKVGDDSLLRAFTPQLQRQVSQQIRMIQLLEQRPVVLMSPFIVTAK